MTDVDARRVTPSRATQVTFFEDRAEVRRIATADVPAGVSWLAVTGVSVALDDPSLVASIDGDRARVTAARVQRRARDEAAVSAEEMAALERELADARARTAAALAAIDRARAGAQRVRALQGAWVEAVQRVPRGLDARWRASWDALDARALQGHDALSAAERAYEDAQLELARVEARHDLARRTHTRYEAVVEVQVEAREAHAVEVQLLYRTPCALWRPEHHCTVTPDPAGHGHVLRVRTWATAWQATGEEWRDVRCRFSTARPAQSAEAPRVTEDALRLRRRTDAERRVVTVDAREQSMAVAGLGRGTRAVEEMPGVEDGGDALWLDAAEPATVPSDGAPVRVEVGEATMPCELDRVAYPERGPGVHLRATATLSAGTPLLAGPVTVARGAEVVGRGRVGYVGRGEPFELGFGVDDGLRVRRRVEEKREVTTVMGHQKIARTVKVFVSNLGALPRTLTVTERVPVSEVKDVEVHVASVGGGRHDPKDGLVRWELEVAGGGTQELTLAYRIEAPSKVSLPF